MKNFLRTSRIVCFLMFFCLPCLSNAQDLPPEWWNNDMIIVRGHGFSVNNDNSARSLSRRAAMLDGYRALAEQVKGVHITAETTIESQIVSGDIIETKVSGIIRDAKILSEEFSPDGTDCVIVMGIPLYGGESSVASVVFKPADKKAFPMPKNFSAATGNYTGLIIDCGDLNLKPVLAPAIRTADNQSIYSRDNLDYNKLITNGMVGYAMNNAAKKISFVSYKTLIENKIMLLTSSSAGNNLSRAGSNPLIIKAAGMTDNDTCPVVSSEDADKILSENLSSNFLDNGSVVFTGYRVGGLRV